MIRNRIWSRPVSDAGLADSAERREAVFGEGMEAFWQERSGPVVMNFAHVLPIAGPRARDLGPRPTTFIGILLYA